jgi:transcription initiation factor TFIID subunit 5
MSNKDDIDSIVKEYLLARGYSKAAAELDQESSVIVEDIQSNLKNTNNKDLTLRILSTMASIADETSHLGLKQANHTLYSSNYDSFRSWAFNSLDIVKTQFISLCFPIFVHW